MGSIDYFVVLVVMLVLFLQ